MPQMFMDHAKDPKQEILDQVGDLSDVGVMFSQVLVGLYLRPNKTKSGLHLPDSVTDEDLYQGCVGLVLKLGPRAYVSAQGLDFRGERVDVGDWVMFRPSDGIGVMIRKHKCRLVGDGLMKMKIPSPDLVF